MTFLSESFRDDWPKHIQEIALLHSKAAILPVSKTIFQTASASLSRSYIVSQEEVRYKREGSGAAMSDRRGRDGPSLMISVSLPVNR